jgi:hypothetical protein
MKRQRRSHWLLPVLCIMTFTGSGFSLLIYLLSVFSLDLIRFTVEIPGYTSIVEHIDYSHFVYRLIKIFIYGLSLTGALYMWHLRIRGFYIYSLAQLSIPVVSFIFLPYAIMLKFTAIIPDLIFSVAFIALYAFHLESMKNKESTT